MAEPPTFLDGEPTNLEGAALDALDWLRFWRDYLNHHHLSSEKWNEGRKRLGGAIKSLETFLPDKPPVFNERGPAPGGGSGGAGGEK